MRAGREAAMPSFSQITHHGAIALYILAYQLQRLAIKHLKAWILFIIQAVM